MERQVDENIKMKLCDYIIYNDEQQLVIPQVLALHHRFIKDGLGFGNQELGIRN